LNNWSKYNKLDYYFFHRDNPARMPVSNKERYAKWRQRQLDDPEKREKLRQREREKYEEA